MHTRTIILALALLLPGAAAASAGASPPPTLTVGRSAYGTVLFDGRGKALYAFTRDRGGRSACSRACAAAWPPYIAGVDPRAGAGAHASLLGTTRRADGTRQVTYAGRPLYYYVGDRKPGQILCQNVSEYGGLWLVVRPNGRLVRAAR
jgi:predicted lipoprotein with Yx(FWY)xxD motif